ncbi:hypothetical protein L7F22_023581 [Adiantum nelumboides]|nr:hypothetical protein [Adiantum nelumboides]
MGWSKLIMPMLLLLIESQNTHALAADGKMIIESDLQALEAIKQAFQDPNGALQSWNSSLGACQGKWDGVKCAQGQVIVLQLVAKGLGGALSAQVGQLLALRKLNLHSNAISGAIPSSLTTLSSLRGLYLNRNRFTGTIPPALGSSPALQSIDLSHNGLTGYIPQALLSYNLNFSSSVSRLYFMDLSNNNLSGTIPPEVFASLPALRELHLSQNMLEGPIPPQLFVLPSLVVLDLAHNRLNSTLAMANVPSLNISLLDLSYNELNGPLPLQIGNFTQLKLLDVSNNHFNSILPQQLGNITGLQTLDLSINSFNGTLPSSLARLKNLTSFNCSFNNLTGVVPQFVHKFNVSSFQGNTGLCGYSSLAACIFPPPSPSQVISSSPSSIPNLGGGGKKHRFSTATFLIIVIGSVVAGILLICLVLALLCVFCRKTPEGGKTGVATVVEKSSSQSSGAGKESAEVGGGKLVHFDGTFTFTADGLLCATAEVLGKSTYGTVYKATFEDGNQVAVKRLREGIVKSQRDFETEVNMLGKIRHPNLLALRGYYWGPKDEKLLIYDFMVGGSLAAFLHARGPETPLNWHTRLNIAVSAARGLAHLHNNERLVHGNLTSSNILLDSRVNAKLSDFGLSRLMTTAANANVIATASALGYRAPELTKLRKATTKSDVYSFGIVLLELLTGKSPGETASTDQTAGMDLPEWVASIVKEEWTNEIFDLELMKGSAPSEDELINTLQLAMNCVTPSPGSRPAIEEVMRQLEETLNKPDQGRQTTSSESSAV